jgi:antitoxin component of RelBE/YafQ-DinJ toxin-antitoxin module
MEAAKLTLSLSKEVIEQAKNIARKKGVSLSKYIQTFLEKSIKTENLEDEIDGNIPEDIRSLRGILKGSDMTNKQIWDMKYEYLKEKHDL